MPDQKILIKELQKRLDKVAKKKTKDWWEKYLRYEIEFRGVNLVQIRDELHIWYNKNKLVNWAYSDQLNLALYFFSERYAEDKLAGVLFLQEYLYDKIKWKILLKRSESLFKQGYVSDWNVCDWFCVRVLGPLIKLNGKECAVAISKWSKSKNLWQARASVVAFVPVYKDKTYHSLIIKSSSILIKRDERFAKTAVGWIMRDLSKVNKNKVAKFLKTHSKYFSQEALKNASKYF